MPTLRRYVFHLSVAAFHSLRNSQEGVYAAALEGALLGYNEAYLLASTKHYSAAIALLEP